MREGRARPARRFRGEARKALRFRRAGSPSQPAGDTARARFPKGREALTAVCLLCLVAGIALAAYPFLSDRLGAWQADRQFSAMRDAGAYADVDADSLLARARAYNEALASGGGAPSAAAYEDQLELDGTGLLCWIEIPKLGLKAPVYKGYADRMDSALMAGAAHVQGTSLPVGGDSANCVITAHSGMRDTRMFDQLDLLEDGDHVVLWTLGVPHAYAVVGRDTVLPQETGVMGIAAGRDLLTLVTCRPVGVNSHRLVVSAERVPYEPETESVDLAYLAEPRLAWFVVALVATALLVWMVLGLALRR